MSLAATKPVVPLFRNKRRYDESSNEQMIERIHTLGIKAGREMTIYRAGDLIYTGFRGTP